MDDARYLEIDTEVEDSGHWFNPSSGRFEATGGSDADNNLDHDPESFRTSALASSVSQDEMGEYMTRKVREQNEKHEQDEIENG